MHDPTGVTPFLLGGGGALTVVTVHDVIPWSCPGSSTLADTLIYRHWLPRVLPRVDAVITVSEASKADIVRCLQVAPDKIHVIHQGVGPAYRPAPAQAVERIRARYRLPDPYILFVGSADKRKNLAGLLRAVAALKETGRSEWLAVAGPAKRDYPELLPLLQELNLEEEVVFLGFVVEADLPALYSGAALFVFPSLYEGFGLPALEAMACGTPVICSNSSSLPEVVGDAAVTVDPRDIGGLARSMQQVLADAGLRHDLRRRGLARAQGFTWARTARETSRLYCLLLQERSAHGR